MSTRAREREAVHKARLEAKKARWDLGRSAVEWGVSEVIRVLKSSRSKTRYWKNKILDPTFHSGPLGGGKRGFSPEKEQEVCFAIKRIVDATPTKGYKLISDDVYRETGHRVSKTYVATVLALNDYT